MAANQIQREVPASRVSLGLEYIFGYASFNVSGSHDDNAAQPGPGEGQVELLGERR